MKAAIIPTLDTALTLMNYTDYQLVLAQHLKDDHTQYYMATVAAITRGDFVILDNGAAEGDQFVSGRELVEMAIALGVDEVVAPDILRKGEGSWLRTQAFLDDWTDELRSHGIDIMAVPQGETFRIWWDYLDIIMEDKRVNTIGIPKNVDEMGMMRALVVDMMYKAGTEHDPQWVNQFHLLGQSNWLGEAKYVAKYHPWVRGIDSAYPVALARQSKLYLSHEQRITSVGSFHISAGPEYNRDTAVKNIQAFIMACIGDA